MRQLTRTEVHLRGIAQLRLDPNTLDLTSVEAIAAALRRSARFLCPCASATLVRAVVEPMKGLVEEIDAFRESVWDTLEAMIAHGDFLEHCDIEGSSNATLVYGAPLGFVARNSGAVILLGVSSNQLSSLPSDLADRVEYVKHLRRLKPLPNEDLSVVLPQLGLRAVSYLGWLQSPGDEAPDQHISRLNRLLDAGPASGAVPGLSILDPEQSVRYYRGRWREVRADSGRFVARRDQAYGSNLWCYVELISGEPQKLLDFPLASSRWRGCDEAWRLQMAIDAQRGNPQRFRLLPGTEAGTVIQFFSPVPAWAQRRWDAVGEPTTNQGCLFAYRLAESEVAEELRFARGTLWLEELE